MFVDRDSDDKIAGAYACRQRSGQEEVADDSAELLAFLNPPPAVPAVASSGDFRHALYDLGWYDAVDAAAKAAGGLALILWTGASEFERYHPLTIQIATAIGKTSADLDELFFKTQTYHA